MITRRLIRIKVLQSLYSCFKAEEPSFAKHENELTFSFEKSYILYLSVLKLLTDFAYLSGQKADAVKNRFIPNPDEETKAKRLAANRAIAMLEISESFNTLIEKHAVSWENDQEIRKELFDLLLESELFLKHVETEPTFDNDRRFVKKIITHFLPLQERFFDFLEEKNIFWNDEVDSLLSMAEKTVKKLTEENECNNEVLPMFNSLDDREYGIKLYRAASNKREDFNEVIKDHLIDWEIERLPELDLLLIQLALFEAREFPQIPVKVTINEYVEIAKLYSTPKSAVFINGVLDRVIKHLREERVIVKEGRGLIE